MVLIVLLLTELRWTLRPSGTAIAPITFEAAPGQKPVIDSSGGWNAIDIQASYIVVSGFTVVGGAANYNLQSALAGYSTGNAESRRERDRF